MYHSPTDYEDLKEVYAIASNRYKPKRIRTLLIGEAPPCATDRFFYFEDVKKQDSLFLEIMGVLYPEEKQRYLKKGRPTEGKADLLQLFQEDGFWLIDLYEVPGDFSKELEEQVVPNLLKRLPKYIDKQTPILLIKANIFDLCYGPLQEAGYNVSEERIPFPGSGQQGVFREKFRRALEAVMR
jgi:hypothetical protein